MLNIRLFTPSTPMDSLVEGQETGVHQQLSLENPHSILKWLAPSKLKEAYLPTPTRRKQPQWNQHYRGHPAMPIILQSPYSFTQTANPYVKFSFHLILEPFHYCFINSISSSIFIQCALGRSAIPGNDLANKAVKEATAITTDTILPVSFSCSILVINETICDALRAHERVPLIYQHRKAPGDAKQINNRKDDVLLARL